MLTKMNPIASSLNNFLFILYNYAVFARLFTVLKYTNVRLFQLIVFLDFWDNDANLNASVQALAEPIWLQFVQNNGIIIQSNFKYEGENMSVYRVAICEDDNIMRENLCSLCNDILTDDGVEYSLESFHSACELEKRLKNENFPFDLLILDIQMKGMTGMELAHSLREKGNRVSIIFVTAYEDYLREGYGVQPIHFFLKPVKREALASAIHTDLKLNYIPKTVVVHIGSKLVHLSLSDIRYIESYNHSIVIHQSTGNSTYYFSLSEFEKQLPKGQFARCHNSYLVNLNAVHEIGRTELHLQNGEVLPIGRTYYKMFQSSFVRYINQ